LLDPQVMPRRLRIAPRLIMLAVLGRVLFAPPPVNGQQVDRDPAVESGTALDLGQLVPVLTSGAAQRRRLVCTIATVGE